MRCQKCDIWNSRLASGRIDSSKEWRNIEYQRHRSRYHIWNKTIMLLNIGPGYESLQLPFAFAVGKKAVSKGQS